MTDPSQKTILLFDDNPDVIDILKIYMKRLNYALVTAEHGMDAAVLIKKHNPILILMDIIMPGKDGIQVCRELRQEGVTVPIVMFTSKDYAEDRRRAIEAGADGYIVKPFDPVKFKDTILPLLAS